jgi:hypothetical protein
MKIRSILVTMLCALAIGTSISSCSNDDDDDSWKDGSKVELADSRAFILNEGSYKMNNANLVYFDWNKDTLITSDIFVKQNGIGLGDTGQDIITYDDNLFVAVYGSNYIAKLNGSGVQKASCNFNQYSNLGKVRYMAAYDGFLYVTTDGGYVSKVKIDDMSYVDSVKVGKNPEGIAESNGKIYCVNSGYGYDNTMSIINTLNFKSTPESVTIFTNPDRVIASNGNIFLQGYGGAYPNFDYQAGVYNKGTKKYTKVGAATCIAAYGDKMYCVNSVTDWSTYKTTNTFYSYDMNNGLNNTSFLKNAPSELSSQSIYGMSINPYTGDIYICVSFYSSGNGIIYHFNADGNYVGQFSSYGQSPKKVVFLK